MKTTRHNVFHCRMCGYKADASTSLFRPDAVPTSGAFSVCLNCGEVSVYEIGPLGVAVREPTLDELAEFTADHPGVVQTMIAFNAQRRR